MNPIPLNNAANYEVESILGKGGMGVVYLAYDKRLNRKVAIKCIRQNRANEHWVEAVQEEAKLLAQINHTNIVQIYDLIDWHGVPALVMEYVCGRTLLDILNSDELHSDAIDFDQRLDWLKQIAEGLACAHAKGIIHRDLKPENIMIAADGAVKIMDFGIARHQAQPKHTNIHDSQVLPGEFVGSPGSLSPEQAVGEDLTTASDVFSFGILAYSLLCGHHPFGDTSDTDTLLHSILYRAPAPFKFNVESDERGQEVAEIIEQSLQKKAKSRPTAANMAVAFKPLPVKKVETVLIETNRKNTSSLNAIIITTLVFIAAGSLALVASLSLEGKQHVAVLKPVVTSDLDNKTIAFTVLDTMRSALLSTNSTELIDQSEWNETDALATIGDQTGADSIIRSELSCQGTRCNITIERLTAPNWNVAQRKSWAVHTSSTQDAYFTTWHNTLKLFDSTAQYRELLNEKSYSIYLEIAEKYDTTSSLSSEDFFELIDELKNNPAFIPGYRLLVDAAISHYDVTNDGTFLRKSSDILRDNQNLIDPEVSIELEILMLAALKQLDAANTKIEELKKFNQYDTYYRFKAKLALDQNDFSRAEELFSQLLASRKSIDIYYSIAYCQYAQGKLNESITTLRNGLELNPEHRKTNSFLAAISMIRGEFKTAAEAYKKIAKNSSHPNDLNNLSIAYFLSGNLSAATQSAIASVDLAPFDPKKQHTLGEIYLAQNKIKEAENHLNMSLKYSKDVSDLSSLILQGTIRVHLGDLVEAHKDLEEAKKLEPENADLIYAEALYFSAKKDIDNAMIRVHSSLEMGYHIGWYNFPWFNALCIDERFQTLFFDAQAKSPCTEAAPVIEGAQ
ncbi:protein kinase [Simiduia curdlanivorans]|uniref:Protein kinase n=1 Tax=Simiduia curdlanivorans TaxID=1492769 RepID=A0ABV8V627_9GAMM|nr:serine/threonine-protein kinase [Simiduia curdlanivorans]MDN3638315.1 protein kinase [Simiduia curdlanivorans]